MELRLCAALAASVSILAICTPVAAQTKPEKPANAATDPAIIVTGSRVVANGNNQPTPVTVVSAVDLLAAHPTNLSEALSELPIFAGSRSQYSNTGTSGAAGAPATSTNALNVLNLRNMGLARSLILWDGHRMPMSTPEGFVDIDTIPQMLLKRVDVVTGGASAVYGSDAIVGVANFVTDTGFNGVKFNIQKGISTYGDGGTVDMGLAGGFKFFDDRAHVLLGATWRKDDGIDSKFARAWGNDVRTLQGAGTAASPYFPMNGARQNNVTFGGKINSGVLADQQFLAGGTLGAFNHGSKSCAGGTIPTSLPYECGGDGGYYNGQIRATLDMKQFFARLDLDITDNLQFNQSLSYVDKYSVGTVNWIANQAITINRDNAFLPASAVTAMTNAGQTSFTMGKIFTDLPRTQLVTSSQQLVSISQLKGKIGEHWRWDANFTHGDTNFRVDQPYALDMSHFYAGIDSVMSGGKAVCRAALTNAAYANCVPINIFGTGSITPDMANYLFHKVGWTTKLKMDDLAANIMGSPFSTWAGPVNIALSGEWRKSSEEVISESLPTNRVVCAGSGISTTTGACNANQSLYSGNVANMPYSTTTVYEFAVEGNIPLLRDMAFAKSLNLNLAYRHAHYDRAGDADTWKIGATWEVADFLTLRATRSRDFRAPTLDELFRPQATSLTSGFFDYLPASANPAQSPLNTINVPTVNGGNPNLKPEIGNTISLGAVFRPTRKLSLAIDYFDIKVKNFIYLVQGNSTEPQQVCYDSKGTSPYCALVARGLGIYDANAANALSSANAVSTWYQLPINIAEQTTYGADIELNYRTGLNHQPLNLRVMATWQPHVRFKQAGVVDNDYAGAAFGSNGVQATPKWRVTAFLDYKVTDNLSINISERWRAKLHYHSSPTVVVAAPDTIKDVAYTNLGASLDVPMGRAKAQMFLNISNLFNVTPPVAGFWGNPNPGQFGEFVAGDDVIGRYFTFGIRGKF